MNTRELVGTLMQGVLADSSQGRIEHALGGRGLSRPGGIFEQLLGGATSGTSPGGLLSGLGEMARSMFGSAGQGDRSGTPLAIGGLGALGGAVLGYGGSTTKRALGGGAMALLGSLALEALLGSLALEALLGSLALEALRGLRYPSTDDASAAVPAALPPGLRRPTNTAEENELESRAMVILQAMLQAAKSDGQIDAAEQQRILDKIDEAGATTAVQEFVRAEMSRSLDLKALLREVSNPQMAAEVYAASLLAIKVDTPAEHDYLRQLAQGLGLDEGAVQRLHLTLGVV